MMDTDDLKTAADFQDFQDALRHMQGAFLRRRGWSHTCSWPGALWLWEKTLPDGKHAACGLFTAMAIEAALEASAQEGE